MIELNINITDFINYQRRHQQLIKEVESVYFYELMRHTNGNKSQAARIANINRATLCAKLKRYKITVEPQIKHSEVTS